MLGSKRDAANKSLMDNMGITHVLNMAQQVPNHHPKDYIYHKINILGMYTQYVTNIDVCFNTSCESKIEDNI